MNKEKTCVGCGVILQAENILQEGYTTDIENDLCQRCFRLKNYGEYQVVTKSNEEYIEILKNIGTTNDLVLLIVDLSNLNRDLTNIKEYISNPTILVLNKRDVLPRSVNDQKILAYLKDQDISYLDMVIVSCRKNFQMDLLYEKIKKYKTSKNVYVVGQTNVGKSSLINQFIRNYSDQTHELTISPLPSTTLNKVVIKLNDELTLIDTPGLVDRGDLSNYVNKEDLKRTHSKTEMRPRTIQIKPGQCVIIDSFARIDYVEGEKNSFVFYVSNQLKIKKMNALKQDRMKDLAKTTFEMKYSTDLVMNGLGWVKIVGRGTIDIYIDKNIELFTRKSFI